jgi:hypothetical protein
MAVTIFISKEGKMTRTPKLLLLAAIAFMGAYAAPSTAEAQPGYGPPQQRITCSSDDGRRSWCDIGGRRDIRLARQISGSPCVQGDTWGVDNRGLWVDRGCRAEFFVGGDRDRDRDQGYPSSQQRIVNCSSNDGRRNWCDVGPSRDIRIGRQISGTPCVEGDTWGVDRRGLWVDRGCRADFVVGGGRDQGFPSSQERIVNCSSNDGRRTWCDVGRSRDISIVRQISGTPCVEGDTWGVDRRGLWVDRGCRGNFRVR